ncbi:hypothetical protein [Streptomyces sp. NPDC000405]|uniref:hypothetical protein n=1 Tax=Streptomyces sp. NPDC000405 TaxID=3161033 RepID=UPI00398CE315
MWLIDSEAVATHVTTGTDWCLIAETSAPFAGYDMAEAGRIEVASTSDETSFRDHLGNTVLAIGEESDLDGRRLALEITFGSGRIRCETWSGELRLSSK